jgi:hypothetical protein
MLWLVYLVHMSRVRGLLFLFFCICIFSFCMQRSARYTTSSNPGTNHTGFEQADQIIGEYRAFRAGLGLQEVHSNVRQSSSHSFPAHPLSPSTDNTIALPRIETANVTSGLSDEPEARKMLRRTPTFGLVYSHRRSGDSHSIPNQLHTEMSEIGNGVAPLHFAADSIREPRTSFEGVLREYTLLSTKEGSLASVDTTIFTKSGGPGSKIKVSHKGKSSSSKTHSRASSVKRSRGRRRLPSHVEH